MDFAMPFIEPFLSDSGITTDKNAVGLLFVALAVSYMVSSVIWGQLCTRYRCSRTLLIAGNMMASLCHFMIGPSPWLNRIGFIIVPSFAQVTIVMVILGM